MVYIHALYHTASYMMSSEYLRQIHVLSLLRVLVAEDFVGHLVYPEVFGVEIS